VKLPQDHSPNAFVDMLKGLINIVHKKGAREKIGKYCISWVSIMYLSMVLDTGK